MAQQAERLRLEVEKMQMASYDSVSTYNIRFREAAATAYPVPRSADAERTLIYAYVRSLYGYNLKKKTLEHHPANLDAAMARAEQLDCDRDQVSRVIGDRNEEPMEVGAVGAQKAQATSPTDTQSLLLSMQK